MRALPAWPEGAEEAAAGRDAGAQAQRLNEPAEAARRQDRSDLHGTRHLCGDRSGPARERIRRCHNTSYVQVRDSMFFPAPACPVAGICAAVLLHRL
jgi:hypothetical protein